MKKIISFFITMSMVFSLVNFNIFADENEAGPIKTFTNTLYGQFDTNNNNPIGKSHSYLGAYGGERALIKFNIGDIKPDYIRKATLKYSSLPSYQTWYTYTPGGDVTTQIDRIDASWAVGDARTTVTVNKTGVAQAYGAAVETNKYAAFTADITEDIKTNAADENGYISYMLRKEAANGDNAKRYILTADVQFIIEVEFLNEYETLQLINNAETGDDIAEILESGLFNDNDTYVKYTKLNNKSVINAALVGEYESYDDFINTFTDEYENYIGNPADEDKAGPIKTFTNTLYGQFDTNNNNPIGKSHSYLGAYGGERALIKFNIGDIKPDYIRKATLKYSSLPSYQTWYTYTPGGDVTTQIDRIDASWAVGDARTTVTVNKTGVAQAYGAAVETNKYAAFTADITEDIKTNAADENGYISYMLRKEAANGNNANRYILTADVQFTIELEFINEYEMFNKYNDVKNDIDALADYINQIATIEGLSNVNPEVAAIFLAGRNFESFDELLRAIKNVGENEQMMVAEEFVQVGSSVQGTFKIKNFSVGTEDSDPDLVYVIVASYADLNRMLEAQIVNFDGSEEIEVPKMLYDDETATFIAGESEELDFELTESVEDIKDIRVFIWENLDTIKPLAEAKSIYNN